ncbi:MAG: UPF0182 family protein [Thermaerobacterales bacterium]
MRISRRLLIYGFLALMAGLFLFGSTVASFYVDWLWFTSLGYAAVFLKILATRVSVGLLGGLLFAAGLFVNLWVARFSVRQLPEGVIPFPYERLLRPRVITWAALAVSLGIGAISGLSFGSQWPVVELFRNQVAFGVTDPIFQRDVSFYVFSLPFYQLVFQTITLVLVFSLLAVGTLYLGTGAISYLGGRLNFHPVARFHLAVLAALLFAAKAVGYYFSTFALLQNTQGAAFGAGYTAIHAQLPALRVLMVLASLGAVAALATAFTRSLRWLYASVIGLVLASLVLGGAWPALMQYFIVNPNELVRERPYLAHNIALTREAFGLSDVNIEEFPASPDLGWEDIAANPRTVENIRLWDVRPLLTTYRQRQNIRQYYNFQDVDVDRYTLNGSYQQVMLSARELDHSLLEPQAQTWVNMHLKFTHGYGVVMNSASQVGVGGQPEFTVSDIPPVSALDLQITRPEIYFGEIISEHAMVLTEEPEFNYPVGDTIAESFYEGTGGVSIGSSLARLAFSLHLSDYNILFTGAITPESRVLINRQVVPRVQKIAPFLRYDRDPYLVISDEGRLFWILDAYTVARGYPYSEPYFGTYAARHLRGINYIRNSVKVLVDAYNGDVSFYVFDDQDPVIATYGEVFPNMFQPAAAMPDDLRLHTRYPEELFRIQSDMYRIYHMSDADIFYNREDVWAIPQELFNQDAVVMDPYYLIMQLPEEEDPEFLLLLPFTPANRENMIGWMAGRSDGERLGELFVFTLPKDRQIFGPMQVEQRINQNADIARDLALWGQQGTRVIRGNLLIIPIEDTLLYVEPLYLRSEDGGLPELRRVIVTYGDRQPVMEASLELALIRLFGAPQDGVELPIEVPDDPGAQIGHLVERASRLYGQALDALRAGNFGRYGDLVEDLGRVLDELAERTGVTPDEDALPNGAETDAGEGAAD